MTFCQDIVDEPANASIVFVCKRQSQCDRLQGTVHKAVIDVLALAGVNDVLVLVTSVIN